LIRCALEVLSPHHAGLRARTQPVTDFSARRLIELASLTNGTGKSTKRQSHRQRGESFSFTLERSWEA
jgi:hypothetical protein